MKNLTKVLFSSSLILLSFNALAASTMSENQMVTQCKTLASAQLDNVKNVKVLTIKKNRFGFKSRFKVIGELERGIFLCTIAKGQDATIARIDKKDTSSLAIN